MSNDKSTGINNVLKMNVFNFTLVRYSRCMTWNSSFIMLFICITLLGDGFDKNIVHGRKNFPESSQADLS